ncbi:MAG: hypothetical protein HN742_14060 [Lentisphaerae bacterium]|jgi:hypothetical protein|nr:hypothetical protein [Lentisphaerota bacterium]MBT5610609.1 hypothetical protein [Lentisphaerota bacterium]MBT7054482.1 hypothetical protein [Lentisphaerota bacterium]MBT7842999.1 hypothetical protein [Lentisphaerota bacterium]
MIDRHAGIFPRHTAQATARTVRVAVDCVKPAVRASVSMVSRHPEAFVGALAGYAVGKQLDRVWGLRHLTGGQARYVLAFIGGVYGYQMALQRRQLDIREDKITSL